jgi:hypothetical protein
VNQFTTNDLEVTTKIEGIAAPTIVAYFQSLNSSEFGAAAELFAECGRLAPPFDNPIEGRAAIATYLEKEARGMTMCPQSGTLLIDDLDLAQYHIEGKVKTNYFTVNVSWLIQLNTDKEILLVEVKLLAALTELIKFRK